MSGLRIAACPLIEREGRHFVVLVTSRKRGEWLLPKGRPEPDMIPRRVAEMEAWEEAGVVGRCEGSPIRFHLDLPDGGARTVIAYRLRVDHLTATWPEQHQRQRLLLAIDGLDGFPLEESWNRCIHRLLAPVTPQTIRRSGMSGRLLRFPVEGRSRSRLP